MLNAARKRFIEKKKHPIVNELIKISAIVFGAILVAVGLELFLVPNNFLDGGITGISIIITSFVDLPLGVILGVLNIPFLVITWRHAGKRAAVRTAIGIFALSVSTILLHHSTPLTTEFTLALGYGGLLLGVGVGIALRYGGALDGAEALAVTISDRTNFGVDQIILFINFFIFIAAAFIFTPERAMASMLLFYIVVTPIIRKVMERGTETKTVQILSSHHEAIAAAVHEKLNHKVLYTKAHRDNNEPFTIITTFIPRVEESTLSEIVEEVDPDAIIIFQDTTNIKGGMFNKNNHH
jgi:uncharacterized membrane-anchored protein YitT (DUF2179 family)